MKFKLFLNRLSASQTIKVNQRSYDLDCYGTCSPYNCSSIPCNETKDGEKLQRFFTNVKKWKTRKENFGYIIYDPTNYRLYETDEEGLSCVNLIKHMEDYSLFCKRLNSDKKINNFVNIAKEVYI